MCGLFSKRSLKGDKTPNGLQAEQDYPSSRPAQQPTKVSDTSKMPNDQKSGGYAPPSDAPPGYMGSQNTGGSTFSSNNPYASQAASSGGGGYAPPSGPPPGQYGGGGGGGGYAPPPGPPPSHQQSYAPPPGPPPSHNPGGGYAPPSGPPPSNSYAPPPGPPPSSKQDDKDKPYQEPFHNWQDAVPDTALLPPPPSMGEDRSWANNASLSDAENGAAFTGAHPLIAPLHLRSEQVEAVEAGDIELMRPFQYVGDVRQLRPRSWTCKARRGSPDACLMSTLPIYSVIAHSPLNIGRKKTIYFEVRIAPHNRSEVSVALGFVAQPYPPFRLPGWDRAGLGVHGDDGHRYINDCWGGKPFTTPFKPGETLGIGMTLSPRRYDGPPPQYGQPQQCPIDTEVFFTKNGEKAGGWNLHEEGDAEQDRPVTGLEGYHDLFAAVGTFEEAEFEVVFEERNWLYRPDQY